MLAKRDFHLQTGNLGYKTGLSFTNGESWVTNGILGLLFTLLNRKEYEKSFTWIDSSPIDVYNNAEVVFVMDDTGA